jgi:hypothetical protein
MFAAGVATSVTTVFTVYASAQSPLADDPSIAQVIPAGIDATDPVPVPDAVTVSWCVTSANVAVTDLASLIVT